MSILSLTGGFVLCVHRYVPVNTTRLVAWFLQSNPTHRNKTKQNKQETARALESLTSEDQHSKFRSWVASNREAVAMLDQHDTDREPPPSPPPALAGVAAAAAAAGQPVTPTYDSWRPDAQDSPSSATATARATSLNRRGGAAAAGATTRGRQQFPPSAGFGWEAGSVGPGAGGVFDPSPGSTRSRRENAASPQFRFRGHDGSISGGEEGGEAGDPPPRGGGSGGRRGGGAVSFSLAMDQSP